MNALKKFLLVALVGLTVVACAKAPESKDFTAFRAANPRSIVVVPVLNHSEEAEAADLFLTTLARPLAERGYYVFPTNMVRGLMETDGLSDPMLVHSADTVQLGSLFGTDTILYVEILSWKVGYNVLSSSVTVGFLYTLKDARTGDLLWQDQETYVHSTSSNSGNFLVDIVANAITAAATNMRADYTPVAMMANTRALHTVGRGIPLGPYAPKFGEDTKQFPATGSGRLTNATEPAVATGGVDPKPDPKPDK